ncbi:MAG: helix-turn-helix transcriptional regulator [Calditrichaeota bacterium]|nr:helix-turn-helix transcriptional regulator [Calditrichota bacterium]
MTTLGEKVRRMRKRRGLTLSQLAALTKVSSVTIHNIEKGIYEPKISTLFDLCYALETPLSYFIEPGPKGLFEVHSSTAKSKSKRKRSSLLASLPQLTRLELMEGGEHFLLKDPGQVVVIHLIFGHLIVVAGERELNAVQGDNIYVDLTEDVTLKAKVNSLGVVVYFPGGSK